MKRTLNKIGPIFFCFMLTDIMILLVFLEIAIEKRYGSIIMFILGVATYYFIPYSFYKYSLELGYWVRMYLMSNKFFIFYLGAKAIWDYKDKIPLFDISLSTFTIAVIIISIMDFFRSYVYMNLENTLYSELYKSYNVKLLMFDSIVKGNLLENTHEKGSLLEKQRFFFQLNSFKKKRPDPINYMKLWVQWSDENANVSADELEDIFNEINQKNQFRNRRTSSIVLNPDISPFERFPDIHNRKWIDGFITLETLKNWNKKHAAFIHSFLSNSPNAPIDIERFSEDIRQINSELAGFYKNINSQERLKKMVHLILVIIEVCILSFCIITLMRISISYFTIAAPMFLLCVFPSIMEKLTTFFILLFTHPFDCGDRIYMSGKNLIIKNIYLFSVEVLLWNGTSVIIPNSRLTKEPIGNAKRSNFQKGYINILIKNNPKQIKCLIDEIEKKAKKNEFIKDVVFKLEGIHDCCNIN
ncbi:Mechanosensitive ion channel protein 9, partial [Cucumispora dikerogammari]